MEKQPTTKQNNSKTSLLQLLTLKTKQKTVEPLNYESLDFRERKTQTKFFNKGYKISSSKKVKRRKTFKKKFQNRISVF